MTLLPLDVLDLTISKGEVERVVQPKRRDSAFVIAKPGV